MTENLYKKDKSSQKANWMAYQDDSVGGSEDIVVSDEDKPTENSKNKSKKKYSVIPQAVRERFIKRVLSKEVTIKEAAREFGLKFSTSKAILQTYKKEGRIGKKKNRERKTKVVNAVFIANINASNAFLSTLTVSPLSEIKNLNPSTTGDESAKSLEAYNKFSDQKFPKGAFAGGYNKVTQNIIREFGNDFLRDFIEKNFGQNRLPPMGMGPERTISGQEAGLNPVSISSTVTAPNLSNARQFINFGTTNTNKTLPSAFNPLSAYASNSILIPQKVSSTNSDAPPLGGGPVNLPNLQSKQFGLSSGSFQKRAFQTYEKDAMADPRNEQINDISVKKFKSGEDSLWEYDMDKSKKDLEDFIYKTHNAMKNNMGGEKPSTSNFSEYKDELNDSSM